MRKMLTLARFGVVALVLAQLSCRGRARADECRAALRQYVIFRSEFRMDTSETARNLQIDEFEKGETFSRAQKRCEKEIGGRELSCLKKAPNGDAWEACID